MNIFIGCVSYDKIKDKYFYDCREYLEKILKDNTLVYGAASTGLMGLSYNVAKESDSKVIGICPQAYMNDLKLLSCDEELITNTVPERTTAVFDSSDALLFLPGGVGTLYELFTAIECKRAGEFDKPIILYNSLGFYDKLINTLFAMHEENFIDFRTLKEIHVSESAEDTLRYIDNYSKNKVKTKVKKI